MYTETERIKMLERIEKVWRKYPELRLGQLLNVSASLNGWRSNDHFYLSDDRLFESLDVFDKKLDI